MARQERPPTLHCMFDHGSSLPYLLPMIGHRDRRGQYLIPPIPDVVDGNKKVADYAVFDVRFWDKFAGRPVGQKRSSLPGTASRVGSAPPLKLILPFWPAMPLETSK